MYRTSMLITISILVVFAVSGCTKKVPDPVLFDDSDIQVEEPRVESAAAPAAGTPAEAAPATPAGGETAIMKLKNAYAEKDKAVSEAIATFDKDKVVAAAKELQAAFEKIAAVKAIQAEASLAEPVAKVQKNIGDLLNALSDEADPSKMESNAKYYYSQVGANWFHINKFIQFNQDIPVEAGAAPKPEEKTEEKPAEVDPTALPGEGDSGGDDDGSWADPDNDEE